MTEGPYWVDVREQRSDVRAGQSGAPLTLDLYVYRSDDSCEPERVAVVDTFSGTATTAAGATPPNDEDMIYQQEVRAGNVLMPSLSGSPSAGYTGTVGIGLSALPAPSSSSSGSSSSGSGNSSGSAPPNSA